MASKINILGLFCVLDPRGQEMEKERDAPKDELDMKVKQMETENNEMRRERDIGKEHLSKLTADYNSKVEQLRQQKEDIIRELNQRIADHKRQVLQLEMQRDHVTDDTINPKKHHDMKVKLPEKERDDARKERDAIKEQLFNLKTKCDTVVTQLQQEKTELIETNKKQVKQLEELKDAIQPTKSGLEFATEKCKSDDVMILSWWLAVNIR